MTVQVGADVCSSVMAEGDLLGAFFTNADGELQNAGYLEFEGDQLAIAVWASESGLGNGFAAGDVIQWAMFDQEGGETILLDSEMNPDFPFSDTFVANGFGQIMSLSIAVISDCTDDDEAMTPFDCSMAITAFGCDGTWNDLSIADACASSCDNCGCTEDDDAAMTPFDCSMAITAFGCDGTWNDLSIASACCVSCDSSAPVLGCTDDSADNYDETATEDDGSCVFSGCMCDLSLIHI